ncbi:MAG: hypothetical protein WB791_04210 [Waddliaceae bacterium]
MERENLTNEKVRTRFTNQFDLINHAIKLAEDLIKSGRHLREHTTTDNPALQAIEELLSHEDKGYDGKEIHAVESTELDIQEEQESIEKEEEEITENFS